MVVKIFGWDLVFCKFRFKICSKKQHCLRESTSLTTISLIRLFKMKVVTKKIFKFKSHLKQHQRKVEKLKVIYWWERRTKSTFFLHNHSSQSKHHFFKMMFCFLFVFVFFFINLSGRKLDSDTDATGDEVSFKVTMVDNSILLFFVLF